MVEFGLTFIFFIFVVLATINMMLAAYNFNLAQRAAWEAARMSAVGGTNDEVADIIYEQFVSKMFASPFMISKAEFDRNTWIVPSNEADRVQGTEVTVTLQYTLGFSFVAMSNIQAAFPVSTRLVVIAPNDEDRDGFHDQLNDAFPGDHDNDGLADGTDTDADGDGIRDLNDVGEIAWNGAAYVIRTKNDAGMWGPPLPADRLDGGFFAAPIIHQLKSPGGADAGLQYAPPPLRPQVIPRFRDGTPGAIVTMVDLSYDSDNDGWEDKFEALYP